MMNLHFFQKSGLLLLAALFSACLLLKAAELPVQSAEIPAADFARKKDLFREWVAAEPTAREVQKVIMRYADLNPQKIKRWQMQSRLRALVPDLSVGHDYARGSSVDLDRGGTSDPDVYIYGPDEVDEGWDVDLSWDLGDLIWSSDQNSIEYRGKQLNDQRQYILTEGMQLYYERRRQQMAVWTNPAKTAQEHYERLLRIDELTSLLDVLTGGYFSLQIDRICDLHPELTELWEYPSSLTP